MMIQRAIPSTNEMLPVIGLGTWQTFDVPAQTAHAVDNMQAGYGPLPDENAREKMAAVLNAI